MLEQNGEQRKVRGFEIFAHKNDTTAIHVVIFFSSSRGGYVQRLQCFRLQRTWLFHYITPLSLPSSHRRSVYVNSFV